MPNASCGGPMYPATSLGGLPQQPKCRIHRMAAMMPKQVIRPRTLPALPIHVLPAQKSVVNVHTVNVQFSLRNALPHRGQRRPEAHGVGNHQAAVLLHGEGSQHLRLCERQSQRNLYEHMFAGLERSLRLCRMPRAGRGYDNRVDVVPCQGFREVYGCQ